MQFRWIAAAPLTLAVAVLGGCTVGPDFERPPWYSPASWFSRDDATTKTARSEPVPEPVDAHWWRLFGDPELTSLVDRVADANLDVRVATIRLAESRAQSGIARADAFPQLNGNASYTREKISDKGVAGFLGGGGAGGGSGGGGLGNSSGNANTNSANGLGGRQGGVPLGNRKSQIPPFDLWQYGIDASWELDLWGRVRRSVESADASVLQSAENRRNMLLSSIAEVARDYIMLRGTQAQLDIARQNLKTAQQSLQLTQERAAGGLTTDLDVANARAQVNTTASQIPTLEQQEASQINAISLLIGQEPHALAGELIQPRPVPPVPPRVPVGLPSELARRRPDIRQAEAQLHSATADVGVAVASFYPSVTLSGSLGIQALQFKDLATWDARNYAFGPSITLPIFQGGRLTATLELRKAQQQEAAVAYQRTVLNAWHEVDNALTAYQTEQRRRDLLIQAVADNRRALGLAQSRYAQGITDFLQVLDAQRNLLSSQQQLADSTTTVSANLVALYKALGGGWEGAYPDQPGVKEASSAGAT
jgi:NodT family efflux transporter outer membrane factor (OMF) lipoprotein